LGKEMVAWHGTHLNQPDWAEESHSIAFSVRGLSQRRLFHLILNSYWEPLDFELPLPLPKTAWRRVVDTSLDAPDDIVSLQEAPSILIRTYRVQPHSMVVLVTS
jgi:glycogen operon protein